MIEHCKGFNKQANTVNELVFNKFKQQQRENENMNMKKKKSYFSQINNKQN